MEIPKKISQGRGWKVTHPRIIHLFSLLILSCKEPFHTKRRCRWSQHGRGKQGSQPSLVSQMPPFPVLGSGAHLGLRNVME